MATTPSGTRSCPAWRRFPQHFKANGYYVAGGGKVYHHMPGFNRRSDWNEYFDQVFDSHYQAVWRAARTSKNFTWPEGFPLNQLPSVKALAKPPQNPNEFDWGPFDKPDDEMGDGQDGAVGREVPAQPPKQPFFLAAGIYRPHLPWYAPRKYFDMYPPTVSPRRRSRTTISTTCPRAGERWPPIVPTISSW